MIVLRFRVGLVFRDECVGFCDLECDYCVVFVLRYW